jgi:hypothetical protein
LKEREIFRPKELEEDFERSKQIIEIEIHR